MPESVIDFLIPIVMNVAFITIAALVLWPMGKTSSAFQLAKGFVVFWVVTLVTVVAVAVVQRMLRISADNHEVAFIGSNVIHGMFLVTGWAAFASLVVHAATQNTTSVATIVIWIVGVLSCLMAYTILTTFHPGTIYTLFNSVTTILSFAIFGIWPGLAQKTYGWFFDLF